MRMNRRGRLGVYAVLFLGAMLFARTAHGEGDPARLPPAGVRVKVEKADGTSAEGTLASGVVQFKTEFGRVALDLAKVRAVDFAGEAATVELDDGQRLHGRIDDAPLQLVLADGTVEHLSPAALREVKIVRPSDTSMLGLAFGLITLTLLEVILGVDNVIVLAIYVNKVAKEQQRKARWIGLGAALGTRVGLLFSLSFLLGLTRPILTLPLPGIAPDARELSWRDIILLAGGLFLIYKSIREMHEKFEVTREDAAAAAAGLAPPRKKPANFLKTILWIAVIDIVFSLDSVITAVGTVDNLTVMIVAMVIAMLVMLAFAGPIGHFVDTHPTVKLLALAFLILIGVMLVIESFGQHMNKGYIYFAMAFAMAMEFLNQRLDRVQQSPDVAGASSG